MTRIIYFGALNFDGSPRDNTKILKYLRGRYCRNSNISVEYNSKKEDIPEDNHLVICFLLDVELCLIMNLLHIYISNKIN